MSVLKISDLVARDIHCGADAPISIPEWAFRPDQWSAAFLRGLRRCAKDWRGRRLWEVGVGTGLSLILLGKWVEDALWYYSDFDERCVPLARQNLETAVGGLAAYPLEGAWDLLTPPDGRIAPEVDVIFGCLPQVPVVHNGFAPDWIAHYYDPVRYPKAQFHALGLGLIETLLTQAREILMPSGSVVLNLSGRPGLKRLKTLFRFCGYEAAVIYEEMIPQHRGTSLASLAALEGAGHPDFEFFADLQGQVAISARQAEERRGRSPIFHKIYVMQGRLL